MPLGPPTQEKVQAAMALKNAILGKLQTERGVHAETAVGCGAILAGTFLLRSFGFDQAGIEPGSAIFSDRANDEGPELLDALQHAMQGLGVAFDGSRMPSEIPDDSVPHLGLLETQHLLGNELVTIAEQGGFSDSDAAHIAAIATAILIRDTQAVLQPETGFLIAATAMVNSSKTAPGPFA